MPAMRVCAQPGCPEKVKAGTRGGRCAKHRRQVERARGTMAQQGRGPMHRRLRIQWRQRIDLGGVSCARCGQPIAPGADFHLDHDDDRTGYLGPSHPLCNMRAGGLARHGIR